MAGWEALHRGCRNPSIGGFELPERTLHPPAANASMLNTGNSYNCTAVHREKVRKAPKPLAHHSRREDGTTINSAGHVLTHLGNGPNRGSNKYPPATSGHTTHRLSNMYPRKMNNHYSIRALQQRLPAVSNAPFYRPRRVKPRTKPGMHPTDRSRDHLCCRSYPKYMPLYMRCCARAVSYRSHPTNTIYSLSLIHI